MTIYYSNKNYLERLKLMSNLEIEDASFIRTIEVIFKDRIRESYHPSEYGRFYRYMKGIDIETGEPIDFGTVFDSLEDEGIIPSIYSHIRFSYNEEKTYNLNERYDRLFIELGKTGKKIVASKWKNWAVLGHRTQTASIKLQFKDLRYGQGFARHDELGISISDTDLVFDFTPLLNKVNEELGLSGWLHISGIARVARRKVHQNGTEVWMDVPIFDERGVITVEGYELGNLQSSIKEYRVSISYKSFLFWLKKELREGRMVGIEEASKFADNLGLELDIRKELTAFTMKPNYDYRCFEALLELAGENQIYFGQDSYLFIINGSRIWEVPRAGAATYAFNDTLSPAELVRKCEVTPKLLILQTTDLQEELGFKGRAIHAKQAETADSEEAEKYFNRWLSDVKKLAGC